MTDSPVATPKSRTDSRLKRSKALFAACLLTLATVGALVSAGGSSAGAAESVNVFDSSAVPADAVDPDTNAVELGMKFTADTDGAVTAIRYYKGQGAYPGTRVGHLWSRGGRLLASVTFDSDTSSGWQEAQLSSPVTISAGQDLHRVVLRARRRIRDDSGLLRESCLVRSAQRACERWRLHVRGLPDVSHRLLGSIELLGGRRLRDVVDAAADHDPAADDHAAADDDPAADDHAAADDDPAADDHAAADDHDPAASAAASERVVPD